METQVSTDGRIAKEISSSNITVNRVYKADYQKENSVTAELKQTVKTVSLYPSMSVSNDMKDNLFVPEDFGSKPKAYENNEGRVAWIDVPVGTTPEKLAELLTSNPTARLYKVLSNKPILTSDQKYAVQNGITTVDVIGSRQAIRYPENHDVVALRGKLILDANGKIQYRSVFFSKTDKADIDERTAEPSEFYASAELIAEINELGQTVL